MFGNRWENKTDPELAAPNPAAAAHAEDAPAPQFDEPAADMAAPAPFPAAPATIRRQPVAAPQPQAATAASGPFEMVKQPAPAPAISETHETAASKESQRLVVGARIHLKGEVSSCDALIVEGHFEGSAESRNVHVARDGSFDGDAEAEVAEISGKFDGTLAVSQKLIVRSTGRVSGTIRYAEIEIEAGGQISGSVQVTTNAPPGASNGARPAHRFDHAQNMEFAS